MKKYLIALWFGLAALSAGAQDFYDVNTIQEIRVNFAQSNWDYLLDSLKDSDDQDFLLVPSVVINGQTFDSVGLKYKGNNSYDPDNAKNPLHLELDFVRKNQNYLGIRDIKLGNAFSDPSFVREVLAFEIIGQYAEAPRANYARIWMNNQFWGVYINVESINKRFARSRFHTDGDNPFFKCNPEDFAGPGTGGNYPDLVYSSADSSDYYDKYKLESDHGWRELLTLMDTLKNHPNGAPALLDVDRVLWMLAFNNAIVNLDSYTGAYAQNYYLYQDENGRWLPVVWDLNLSFGAFPLLNPPGGAGGPPLTLLQMQQLSPLAQSTNPERPLISQLLANPVWQRMYLAHLRTIVQENLAGGAYADRALELQAGIDADVLADTKKFFSYTAFQNSLTQTSSGSGPFDSPGLSQLIEPRYNFLITNAYLTPSPPAITGIAAQATGANTAWVTANLTGADDAWVGWRFDSAAVFQKSPFYDDGQHQDGAASDGVFGASFPLQAPHAQYFLYAENAGAGQFAPERAEHEFFTLNAVLPTATAGQVVLNELLADNESGATDEAGDREDWLELYNTTNQTLSLAGLYLSDKPNNPAKWAFPATAFIPAGGYRIVWLDEEGNEGDYHANFKAGAAGESLLLSAGAGQVFDQLIFGPQQPDLSFGRFPNGTGPFVTMPTTFNAPNSLSSGVSDWFSSDIQIFPNPVTDILHLIAKVPTDRVQVFDLLGRPVLSGVFQAEKNGGAVELDFGHLPPGIYCIQAGPRLQRWVVVQR